MGMALIDGYLAVFLAEQGATEDDLSTALEAFHASDDPYLKGFYSLIVKKMDFLHWANYMRKNTCLCCLGGFHEQAAAAAASGAAPQVYAASEAVPAPYSASE